MPLAMAIGFLKSHSYVNTCLIGRGRMLGIEVAFILPQACNRCSLHASNRPTYWTDENAEHATQLCWRCHPLV